MIAAMWWRRLPWPRPIRRIGCLLLALVVLLAAATASAQMSPQEQFVKGQTLFDDGKFEEALPFFQDAFERTESPNASLYVARCLEKLERLDEAYMAMQATVSLATRKANEDEKYASTRDAAAQELVLLKPRVGLVVVAFTEEYPGAVAKLNDRELSEGELGVAVAVTPGMVTIVGTAEGRETVSKTVEVAGGEMKTVALALAEAAGTPDSPSDDGPGFEITTIRAAGFAVAAVGVAGMVVFAITGSLASSKFSQVEEECGGVRCTDPAYGDEIDEGKTLSTVANVSVAVGGAALIAGVLMIILGGPEEADAPEAGALRVVPVAGGVGLGVSF